jgi:hypothetical protein
LFFEVELECLRGESRGSRVEEIGNYIIILLLSGPGMKIPRN